jgi:hypothetical protein
MVKKVIKDPFMGEIELNLVAQKTMSLMGEDRTDRYYKDKYDNLYIETSSTNTITWDGVPPGFQLETETKPMMFISKLMIEQILEIYG